MSDMILLDSTAGVKYAPVLCPVCGMISRRMLSDPYQPESECRLASPHTCPVCKSTYETCDPAQAEQWSAEYEHFERDPEDYSQKVINNYVGAPAPASADGENTPVSAENTPESAQTELERKIDQWKRDLLDTGKRNRMINYRETTRATLRILEPEAAELFNKLAFSDKPLTFQKPITKDSDLRTYSMIALMETLSYNLNVQVGDIKTAATVVEQSKTLKNLRSKTKLAQEEQGTNILYLCFGFIHWRESDRPSAPFMKAPLLLMPVSLGVKSLNAPFTLSRFDDEIEVNPTLSYMLQTEYKVELPPFELKNRQSFEEYLAEIEKIVDRRGWKLSRDVSLGLLSFLKISMYHDLNNNRERILGNPVLKAMAGDSSSLGDLPAQAENFDFDGVKPDEWHEIVDADSSQEEAILLAKLGVSFVMQGPPGTGKSQTITNIIADALADGKKVLFVSEKAAALEVVLKRLTDAHLEDFCLALHNYRANKKEIIDSIGANLSLRDEFVDDEELQELTELFHDRDFLNEYAKELHGNIAPLEQSVYRIMGRLSRLERATVIDFSFDAPETVSKEQYSDLLFRVSAFETALRALDGRLSENPWFGTKAASAGQTYKDQLLRESGGLADDLRRIEVLAAVIDGELGSGLAGSFNNAKSLYDIAAVLRSVPPHMERGWFASGAPARGKAAVSEAREHAERLARSRSDVLEAWDESVLSADLDDFEKHFRGDMSQICTSGADANRRFDEERDAARELKQQIESTLSVFREGRDLIAAGPGESVADVQRVARVLKLISDAPQLDAGWFDARKAAGALTLADEAKSRCAAVADLTAQILQNWEPSVFSVDSDSMIVRFKADYVGMLHSIKSQYKKDMRELQLHSKNVGKKISEKDAADLLRAMNELKTQRAWLYANSSALTDLAGNLYNGEKTDWAAVRAGISKAVAVANEFPYSSVPRESVDAIIAVAGSEKLTADVRRVSEALAAQNADSLEDALKKSPALTVFSPDADLSGKIIPQIDAFIANCESQRDQYAELAKAKKLGAPTADDISSLLSRVAAIKEEKAWFALHGEELKALAKDAYKEEDSDWDALAAGFGAVEKLSTVFAGAVPEMIVSFVCGGGFSDEARSAIDELGALIASAEPKLASFSDQFTSEDFGSKPLETAAKRHDDCLNGFDKLNKWLDYVETAKECNKLGLADFTAKIAELDNTVQDVRDAFERRFFTLWLNKQLDGVPAVQSFRRRVYEQRAERFSKLDAGQYKTVRHTIRKKLIDSFPDPSKVTKSGSEIGILRHEMDKKRRIMPLRKLFRTIPNLLLTLKPCLMMSPLSVAYFLDANSYNFDMVIFDEASQIFPQDAVGAIFRAKQVVIAGDTKQLPPTSFFAASTNNGSEGYDDDEGYDGEEYDSILEETANILPNRTLLWHYRSRHEHLIAFSNQEIYKNRLVTFPSSTESEPDTGVEFVYVEDGYYEPKPRNYNTTEARRIVELIGEHIEKHPDRSLGVIAFSEKQQQAILNEIQRFREQHREYESFFAEGGEEEFFVKNLENVQGDERDTIIFSVGYAKTKAQKENGSPMSMNFGPLNKVGGERRLNVAITRAKINVKLVSSILPSDIDLSRTDSDGVHMLRSYIEFAMNGEATLASAHKSGQTDVFADSVANFLCEHGYKARRNVGCSGYRIDIAVEHPSDGVKQFVAGIECDGFSYASARTARDRDRLRSSVLKKMGWNLYRVWSAEWYNNPELEGQALLEFVESAIRSCNEKLAALEAAKRDEADAISEDGAVEPTELEALPEDGATEATETDATPEDSAIETIEPEATPEDGVTETTEPDAISEDGAVETTEPDATPEDDATETTEPDAIPDDDAVEPTEAPEA